jgi:hypothetical protein
MKKDGYTTIPRAMPLILKSWMTCRRKARVINLPWSCGAGPTTNARHPHQPTEMAFHSGFTGQRALATWRNRMQILADLEFIDMKPGPSGPMSYSLLWNPYEVIKSITTPSTLG